MKSNLLVFVCLLIIFLPTVVLGADGALGDLPAFIPLVGIPGINENEPGLEMYINAIYRLAISLAALLAVVKIVIAGAKYMLDDIVTHKEEAKKDIWGALMGLLVIIAAVVILNTINSDLTKTDFLLDAVVVDNRIAKTALEVSCDAGGGCTILGCWNVSGWMNIPGAQLGNRDFMSCKTRCDFIKGSLLAEDRFIGEAISCVVTNDNLDTARKVEGDNISYGTNDCNARETESTCTFNNFCTWTNDTIYLTLASAEEQCRNDCLELITTTGKDTQYDPINKMCFTKTGYPNITSGTITTVATQTYTIRPTADQVAAGEIPYKITFVSTEIVNGYVQVKDSVTGIESQVSCKNIIPAVCL